MTWFSTSGPPSECSRRPAGSSSRKAAKWVAGSLNQRGVERCSMEAWGMGFQVPSATWASCSGTVLPHHEPLRVQDHPNRRSCKTPRTILWKYFQLQDSKTILRKTWTLWGSEAKTPSPCVGSRERHPNQRGVTCRLWITEPISFLPGSPFAKAHAPICRDQES